MATRARTKDTANFLCPACKSVMCDDCQSMAEEYERLHQLGRRAQYEGSEEIKRLRRELEDEKRKAAQWERAARLGLPATLQAFYDALELPELCRRIEAAQKKYTDGK